MKTHGMKKTSIYNTWCNIKARCYNINNPRYKSYGGRGITVCARWKDSFENFFNDIGERPSKLYTIDRIDNEGNYTPDNCKWSTQLEQQNNKRSNRLLIYNGVTMNLGQWAKKLNIGATTLRWRLRNWPTDRCFTPKIPQI